MVRRFSRCCLYLALALGAMSLAGCDGRPKRVPVSGRVLIDGQPLQRGFIQVIPSDARAANGEIGPDGSFHLTTFDPNDGCVLGTHKVAIIANESQGANAMKWYAPAKYADPLKSGLTLDVTEPRNDVEIKLTWDGGAPFVEKFEDEGAQPAPE